MPRTKGTCLVRANLGIDHQETTLGLHRTSAGYEKPILGQEEITWAIPYLKNHNKSILYKEMLRLVRTYAGYAYIGHVSRNLSLVCQDQALDQPNHQ